MTAQEFIGRAVLKHRATGVHDTHVILDEPLYQTLIRELNETMVTVFVGEFMGFRVLVRRVSIGWTLNPSAVEFVTHPKYIR